MATKGIRLHKIAGSRIRTPKGVARYAYITKPDDSTYGKGKFRITVVFDKADPEFKAFVKKMNAMNKLVAADCGQEMQPLPIKLTDEKMSKGKNGKGGTGDPVGTPYMQFETNGRDQAGELKTIPTFNARAQEEAVLVYGGDVVRVGATIGGWELNGTCGVKGYLNSVQLLQSNWTGGGNLFEADEDYITDDEEVGADDVADLEDEGFEDEDEGFEDEGDPDTESEGEGEEDPLDSLL